MYARKDDNKMQIVTDKTVPQTSQDIGEVVHNTVSNAHKRSHAIADKISARHDQHGWNSDLGRRIHNTASVGEDHGWQDGTDEKSPVEKQ